MGTWRGTAYWLVLLGLSWLHSNSPGPPFRGDSLSLLPSEMDSPMSINNKENSHTDLTIGWSDGDISSVKTSPFLIYLGLCQVNKTNQHNDQVFPKAENKIEQIPLYWSQGPQFLLSVDKGIWHDPLLLWGYLKLCAIFVIEWMAPKLGRAMGRWRAGVRWWHGPYAGMVAAPGETFLLAWTSIFDTILTRNV